MPTPIPMPVITGDAADLANVVPARGQLSHERDTGVFKTGDGATSHSGLPTPSAASSVFGHWLYGDGSDGAITLHDGDVLHAGNYTDVTIVAGATVTVDPAPVGVSGRIPIVCCTGTFTINGVVDLSGISATDRLLNGTYAGGLNIGDDGQVSIFPGGAGGAGASGPGGAAGAQSNRVRNLLVAMFDAYPGGGGNAAFGSGDGTNYGGAGGGPGNWFILCAKTIAHGPDNNYILQGGNGAPGGDDGTGSTGHGNCGGGGGGGGGWWLTVSDELIGTAGESGTGGAGGPGCGTGTDGLPGTTGHGIHLLNRSS